MSTAEKPTVLCVDDEPNVLSGLSLHLRRDYQVLTATSGEEGLKLLAAKPDTAAIISDMRMPSMDGAAFLARARKQSPNTTRILLTGYADIEAAIRAVNQGHLFRFLTKPCPPDELKTVVKAGVAQHRLISAERELLEQTLHGSVAALSEALALAVPEVYGGLSAVHTLAESLGRIANLQPAWPLRIASMLAYLGFVNLPRDVAVRAVEGEVLSGHEAEMVAQAPQTAARLLGDIPRLGMVRDIIRLTFGDKEVLSERQPGATLDLIQESAEFLRLAMDFHRRTSGDGAAFSEDQVLAQMREETTRYSRQRLEFLAQYLGEIRDNAVVEVATQQLRIGMTLAEGLWTTQGEGVLVAAKGYVVTENFLARLHNFPRDSVLDTIKVRMAKAKGGDEDVIEEVPLNSGLVEPEA